tara:strand:- start:4166 stop:5194 length:1029 start_codon:yes stop_codon:yes gene_type:complete
LKLLVSKKFKKHRLKILYIIGNGFDLNLGLKTSYKNFYEYYKSIKSSKSQVNILKQNISSNYNNWSDLELALGQYTAELKTLDEFDEVFEDIGEQLAEYLKKEESKLDQNTIDKEKFFENLVKPEDFLPIADNNKIKTFKNNWLNHHWYIDIMTFNYTTVIERIIGNKKNIKIGYHPKHKDIITLRSVDHIHGFVDKNMVLGVNDISQLGNKEFQKNEDILEAIIKKECNKAYRHTIDDLFKTRIKQADMICIFGSSIGDTDNMWWELIGEKLSTKPIPVIIFTRGEEVINPRIGYKNNRTERKMRKFFLKKAKVDENKIDVISENIYVALDTSMFRNVNKG